MAADLILTSAEDGATLRLSHAGNGRNSILATASGAGFSLSAPVYTYLSPSLPAFFESLKDPPPAGRKELAWASLEGDLKLVATLDSLGHIFLEYEMRSPDIGSNKWWSFTGRLVLELGAIPGYCKQAQAFWHDAT